MFQHMYMLWDDLINIYHLKYFIWWENWKEKKIFFWCLDSGLNENAFF